jgi:hypothetical protein
MREDLGACGRTDDYDDWVEWSKMKTSLPSTKVEFSVIFHYLFQCFLFYSFKVVIGCPRDVCARSLRLFWGDTREIIVEVCENKKNHCTVYTKKSSILCDTETMSAKRLLIKYKQPFWHKKTNIHSAKYVISIFIIDYSFYLAVDQSLSVSCFSFFFFIQKFKRRINNWEYKTIKYVSPFFTIFWFVLDLIPLSSIRLDII